MKLKIKYYFFKNFQRIHNLIDQVEEYIVERKEVGKKSWKQVATSSHTTIEIRGLKKDSSYNFRVIAKNSVGCSEPFIIEETFTAAKADIPKSMNEFKN